MMDCIAKKTPLGYNLSCAGKTVFAERQADLYFIVELDGEKHKGYLKDLKARVALWAQGRENADPAPSAPPPVAQEDSPIVEDREVQGGTGRRNKRYTEEGSAVDDEDKEDPLPTMDDKAELVGENPSYEVRVQRPSKRFPYEDGYAMIEKATRLQTGWTKDKSRSLECLASKR